MNPEPIVGIAIYAVGGVALILWWIWYNKEQARKRFEESKKNPAVPPTQIIPRKCPQCGAELKTDVPEGLCPACLLQRGIATEGGAPPGTPPFVPPTIPDLARLFPQLEILELIGKGGMGAVYKARQPALDRFIALKILAPRSGGDLDFAERFTREARALARLSHPNIVAVYDFGQIQRSAGVPPAPDAAGETPALPLSYFIMEYVDGPNLRQVEQAGRLSPREALEIIPQICAALQFAHDEGIVHRDIKPENVLLNKKGRVKIADFGLAKILGQEPKDFRLTGVRDVVGTPHYMAPEQIEKPQTVDHRADIYSLGVVFYEMLTGELPLGKFQPPSFRTRGVQIDVRLDEVVLRALAKEPERRYQQASQVKTAVETIAAGEPKSETGRQDQGVPVPVATGPRRFSRTAVVGAIWIGLFFLNWVAAYTPPGWALRHFFRNSPLGQAFDLLVFVPLMLLGFASMAGGSVLGVVALRQIRQARREIRGLGLALFDVLFLPLLLVNWWAVWLASLVASQISFAGSAGVETSQVPGLAVVALVLIGLALNGLLIRTAARMAKQFVNSPAPPARPPVTGTWSQVFKAVALRLLLVAAAHLALFETLEQVSGRWKESTGELWGIALAVATLGGLAWVCWPGYRLKRSWLFWAGGMISSAFLLLALVNVYSWILRPNLGLYREPDWVPQHPGFQRQQRERIEKSLWRKPDTIPPTREKLMPLVEDFFRHNFRDVTSRETLEWGEVTTAENGDAAIRYKYRAKIWDKDTITNNQVFTFAPDGTFVSVKGVYGDSKERMMALVEKFFGNNYRDITSRETLEWGDVVAAENGSSSIRYKYRAKIWNKDTVTNNQIFTFNSQDKFVSVKDVATAGMPGEGASGQPASGMDPLAVRTYTVGKKVSDFPTNEDLSTPEAAYALFNRACASGDQAVWGRLSIESIARHFPADAPPRKMSAQTVDEWLNAEVVEVDIYRGGFAMVFARIPPAWKKIIDIRSLELQNGRWLNAGNDVVGSLEEARKRFARRCAYRDAERGASPLPKEKHDETLRSSGPGDPAATVSEPATFGASIETTLKSLQERTAELLDLDTGKITAISPFTDKTDTFIFRTREGGQGALQILGQAETSRAVKIRYKLVEPPVEPPGRN